LKVLGPPLERVALAMLSTMEEEAVAVLDARTNQVGELRKKKRRCEEEVDRVGKALSMHNTAYIAMFQAGKEAFHIHKAARAAVHRAQEEGVKDMSRLTAALTSAEEDLKRMTSWCVTSRTDAQLLEEKYEKDMELLKGVESDIARVSLPLVAQPPVHSEVRDLKAAIQLLSTWM
jgi:hypothetical protein